MVVTWWIETFWPGPHEAVQTPFAAGMSHTDAVIQASLALCWHEGGINDGFLDFCPGCPSYM